MHNNYNSRSSPMVHMICLLLASGILITLCDATCNGTQPKRLSRGQKLTGCMDGEILREFNSKWTLDDCSECKCFPDGSIDCCTQVTKPAFTDPECVAVLDKTTCNYKITRKDNSAQPCLVKGVM